MVFLFLSIFFVLLAISSLVTKIIAMQSCTNSNDSTASFSTHSNNRMLNGDDSDRKNTMRSVIKLATIIVISGFIAGCLFATIGWKAEQRSIREDFERSASVTIAKISVAFDDYQSVASMIHGQCRHRPQFDVSSLLEDKTNYTNYYKTWSDKFRSDFRRLYEYVAASGLRFRAIQFDPNITSSERSIAEEEATEYYEEHYPEVNYTGFRGWIYRQSTSLEPRWHNRSFYFPIHYTEPIPGNEAAIDLDYYSSESRIRAVDALFETKKPSLTDRLSCGCSGGNDPHVDDEGPSFGIVLMHPGVKLTEDDDTSWPKDFSSIVLCVPDLMRRSAIHQKRKVSVYIHDLSHSKEDDPVFMGAVRLIPTHPDDYSSTGRHNELVVVEEEATITMQQLKEVPLEELHRNHHDSLCYKQTISIADREWTVSILDEETPNHTRCIFVFLMGVVIFTASIGLAVWLIANDNRNRRYVSIQSKAAAERTSLILENANNAAKTERELNDFLAHEVRNPLAAAMAATQFLKTELDRTRNRNSTVSIAGHFKDEDVYENDRDSINDNNDDDNDDCDHRQLVSLESPLQTLDNRDSSAKSDTSSRLVQAREDVRVVDHALRFINDLLRNMLDMHRAASSQLQVNMSPVDLLRDILEPVAGMLQRGGERNGSRKSRADDKVKILVDCPENLFVMTDPLRLKQVILNLGRNSVKFVHEGFIRLRAEVVVVVDNSNGTVTINDYDSGNIEAGTSTPPNSTVRLYVEDSGSGIPFEKRGKLFAKYQESLDLLSQGTGIGLHLCKNLVDLMGGEISLDNEYDSGVPGYSGARFIIDLQSGPVDLPVIAFPMFDGDDDDDTDDDISSRKFTKSDGTGITHEMDDDMNSLPQELPETLNVLFVDDDSILRKLFSRSIKRVRPGWTIREAANGETAILLAEEEDFDLIFCDMYMASVEKQLLGTETVAELRAKGITCRICGLSANDKEIEFLEAGSDTFLLKPMPCEANALKQTLYRVLYAQHRSDH